MGHEAPRVHHIRRRISLGELMSDMDFGLGRQSSTIQQASCTLEEYVNVSKVGGGRDNGGEGKLEGLRLAFI